MNMLDALVGSYLEERLLVPDRLKELIAGLLKRREEHVARQKVTHRRPSSFERLVG